MVCFAQVMHLSCVDTNTSPNRPKKDSTRPSSPRSSIRSVQNNFWASNMIGANRAPILHQDLHNLQTDTNKLPLKPCHRGVSSGVSKAISEPMVCLAQTMLISCTDTNTASKRTEMRFHMTHVPLEFHRVRPNQFLSLWYVGTKYAPILCQD
jgi:hypothetical protein